MFLTADGESGKAGGNETIRVDEAGRLRIKVPAALVEQFGTHLVIAAPVQFQPPRRRVVRRGWRRGERCATTSATTPTGALVSGRSWKTAPEPVAELDELRAGPVLGVDLNADHLAAVCSTRRATRSVNPSPSPCDTAGWRLRGAMGGCARPSAGCSTTPTSTTARRSWSRTSTSPTRAPPAGKPWAADSAESDCAAPSPASPPRSSAPG